MSDSQRPNGLPNRRPEIPNKQTEESFSLPDLSGIEMPELPNEYNAVLSVEQVTTKDANGDKVTKTHIKRSVKKGLSVLQKWVLAGVALIITSILGTLITVWSAPVIDALTPAPEATDKANTAVAINEDPVTLGDFKTAGWAQPMVISDKPVATIEGDQYSIDVFLLAIEPAIADSDYKLSDEVTPVIKTGDPVAYFSFVYTNTSGATINTSESAIAYSPYMSTNDITATMIPQDLNSKFENQLGFTDASGMYSIAKPQYTDDVLAWKDGESVAMYKNFPIKGVSNIELYTRVAQLVDDGSGDMDFNADDFVTEGSFDWTLGEAMLRPTIVK